MHRRLGATKIPWPNAGEACTVLGTDAAVSAYALAAAYQGYLNKNQTKPLLVVAPDEKTCHDFLPDLQFFLPDMMQLRFPYRPRTMTSAILIGEGIQAQRIHAAWRARQAQVMHEPIVIVTSLASLSQQTIPHQLLNSYSISLQVDQEINRDKWVRQLVEAGFEKHSEVTSVGQMAVRGGVLDLWSMNEPLPTRFEFFGDQIDGIRQFNPATQRSESALQNVQIIPFREVIVNDETRDRAIKRIKELGDELGLPRTIRQPYADQLKNIGHFPGVEDFLPGFYKTHETLFDSLGKDCLVTFINRSDSWQQYTHTYERNQQLFKELEENQEGLFDPTSHLPPEKMQQQLSEMTAIQGQIVVEELPEENSGHTITVESDRLVDYKVPEQTGRRQALIARVEEWLEMGYAVVAAAQSTPQLDRLTKLLPKHERLSIHLGKLRHGFILHDAKVVFIAEHDLLGPRVYSERRAKVSARESAQLSDFELDAAVVHIDHGVGLYRGLVHMQVAQIESDFLKLEYKGGDLLYLPIYRLNLIQPYVAGDQDIQPELDRLGAGSWARKKSLAKKAVREMAEKLLKLYAKRQVANREAHQVSDEYVDRFEAGFAFEETRDQLRAIEDVYADMSDEKPMDRLVCGDVGFGKTEVAMRAAYLAVMEGKQVAVLVPTTILAQQHFQSFQKRFEEQPAKIDFLSRFKSTAEQKQLVEEIAQGKIDVVIGTHRLLSKDVKFKDLGLLVVDEEHRFGVTHKERIKEYREKVDVLTLTATPIPRTMQMSLFGLRDMSIISTPPAERRAVKTYVAKFGDAVIKQAIEAELDRGGQAFFVHNRVQTIGGMHQYLSKLLPKASIGVAHGQMREKDLEKVMMKFLMKEHDVLLCTSIIESGLDFPAANTILINRADNFGLAQLYQLRGRVGRSSREAFAYLLVPGEDLIAKNAQKRLRVLRSFTELGSGYRVAMHDLEIRGAGNLLGDKQSGHVQAVGFDLYCRMIENAVKELKGEKVEVDIEPEMDLPVKAYIPTEVIPDEKLRLQLYRRLSACKTEAEIEELRQEIIDRYGKIDSQLNSLLDVIAVRAIAKALRLKALSLNKDGLKFTFDRTTEVKPEKIVGFLGANEPRARMIGADTVAIGNPASEAAIDLASAKKLLKELL